MDIDKILDEIAAANVDAAAFGKKLREKAHGLYQVIYNEGHAAAEKTSADKLAAAETAKTEAVTAKEKAEADLKVAEQKNPDLEQVRREHQEELTKLQQAETAKREAIEKRLRDTRTAQTRAQIKAALVKAGVDEDYADVQLLKNAERIQHDDDGNATVLQSGLTIPYGNVPEGKTHLDLLADEIVKATPPKFVGADVRGGSGAQQSGAAGGGSGSRLQKAAEEGAAAGKQASQAAQKGYFE